MVATTESKVTINGKFYATGVQILFHKINSYDKSYTTDTKCKLNGQTRIKQTND